MTTITNKLTAAQMAVIRRMQAGDLLFFNSMKGNYYFSTSRGYDGVTIPARNLLKKGFIKISEDAPFYTKPMELTATRESIK
ncbi:hypothetical protein PF919_004916 [Salmonella enterica]|nr:hypothetical protein [Salmonella enterica]ECC9077803.1 hypothetical protein [Salmonella enterica subsp. enterica]EIK9774888.1 hypothetical protein [Salmonella enterica]EIL4623214.1 hypothetical protein [Salmonella enterica]EKI7237715.1 hypothetical protein [Salmonella enterica]